MQPSLIVSFTSHPARIQVVPQVLESLYSQSMKPDRILLWLAEEQFPNKEADLPKALIDDAAAGKFELRWCDDLGSHKKYYYSMIEFPNDIIITVDDDIHYDPRMVETLYKSYKKFPNAISAEKVTLILFDKEGKLMPCSEWIITHVALTEEPSLQLMALGNRGILYPPSIYNPSDYGLETIKKYCCTGGVVFDDDSWLKIQELKLGIPVVCTGGKLGSAQITGTEITTMRYNQENEAKLQAGEFKMWQDLAENLEAIKESPNFIASKDDAILKNIGPRLRVSLGEDGSCRTVSNRLGVIHYSMLEINRLKAQGLSLDKLSAYIEEYRGILNGLPDLDLLKSKSVAISALTDYGAVLRTKLFGSMFNSKDCYMQMLKSWTLFLTEHSDCEPIYRDGYDIFLKNTEDAIKKAESNLSKAEIDEWKAEYENAIKAYSKATNKEKPRRGILERIRRIFKD